MKYKIENKIDFNKISKISEKILYYRSKFSSIY